VPGLQFRLQVLLDQRAEQKQRAEEALAACEKELAAEKRTMCELEEEMQRAVKAYQEQRLERVMAGPRAGLASVNTDNLLLARKQDLEVAQSGLLAQQVFVDQASEAVEQATAELAERRRDFEALDKYKEKQKKKFLQEVARKEEVEQDEIGNVMHLSRQAK
jgi:flagellar biosynthesis chaperone FliJ